MSTNPLPLNAGLTARLVYVQSCPDCRAVAVHWATRWVYDPAVASAQLIASKKNHCCENGDALDREKRGHRDDRKLADIMKEVQLELGEDDEMEHCEHGLTVGCCAVCDLPVSDTNGNLLPHQLPNGFD